MYKDLYCCAFICLVTDADERSLAVPTTNARMKNYPQYHDVLGDNTKIPYTNCCSSFAYIPIQNKKQRTLQGTVPRVSNVLNVYACYCKCIYNFTINYYNNAQINVNL